MISQYIYDISDIIMTFNIIIIIAGGKRKHWDRVGPPLVCNAGGEFTQRRSARKRFSYTNLGIRIHILITTAKKL